jgi:pSer/pThr/pTyr-binding forkhead associated (FHA) protein
VHTLERSSEPLLQELIDQILQRSKTIEQVPTLTLDLEIHGQHDQQVFQQAVVSVGRSEENNLVILDRQVSRCHALFKVSSKGLIIRDLGSSNGLRVQKQYLHNEEQVIPTGSKIYLCPSDDILITAHWSMMTAKSQEQPITVLEKMLWLRSSPLFQTLNHQSLLALAQSSSLSIYKQNQILCERGETAQALWLLLDGTVQSDHRTLSVGQMIGELGILTRRTYAETVVVTSPQVSVLVISATGFDDLLDREPHISRSLLASISQRLQTSL